ncbi:MAG: hypothetical protein WD226_09290 [Planctomycetota bacterium]
MTLDQLLQLIDEHPAYGPAMRKAVDAGVPLVLNYHDHGGQGTYCVSIAAKETAAFDLLMKGVENLRELAHVEGFGPNVEECRPRCEALAVTLLAHYELERLPEIYLNGEPAPA